jgi:hypothetical protein
MSTQSRGHATHIPPPDWGTQSVLGAKLFTTMEVGAAR